MKHIFLTIPAGSNTGLTSITIGLMRAIDRDGLNVGFYKPFNQNYHAVEDVSSAYIREVTPLNPPASMSWHDIEEKLSKGNVDVILSEIVETVEVMQEQHDVIVIEGLIPTADLSLADELNAGLASSLNAEIVIVKRPESNDPLEIEKFLDLFISGLPLSCKRTKPAVILNKVSSGLMSEGEGVNAIQAFREFFNTENFDLLGVVPSVKELNYIRMSDLSRAIGARIIHDGNLDERRVSSICLCARHVENIIHRFTKGTLIVAPADRSDILMAAALAVHRGVEIAGIVLTSDLEPDEKVLEFCNDSFDQLSGLPILKVQSDSFNTANTLIHLSDEIPASDHKRIELVMDTVARYLDSGWLRNRISSDIKKRLSPVAFKHQLTRRARRAEKTILMPEGEEERMIKAALECAQRNIAQCILIGDPQKIQNKIKLLVGSCPTGLQVLDPCSVRGDYVNALYERRKHKGESLESAKEDLEDNIVLASLMVAEGAADGLVAGSTHSSARVIRPALRIIKPEKNSTVVSSVFFMCLPEQVFIYGDCAVNPDPTATQLADIAEQSANSAKAFGIEPKIAMISYSTRDSSSGSDVEKVKEATRLLKLRRPDLLVDGPLQYDAAMSPAVAKKKAPGSPVAGSANVFIFPDLNTGNTTYKAVQRSADVATFGPILQGLNKPVNDLSRGTSVEDIIYTVAITAVQATAYLGKDA